MADVLNEWINTSAASVIGSVIERICVCRRSIIDCGIYLYISMRLSLYSVHRKGAGLCLGLTLFEGAFVGAESCHIIYQMS